MAPTCRRVQAIGRSKRMARKAAQMRPDTTRTAHLLVATMLQETVSPWSARGATGLTRSAAEDSCCGRHLMETRQHLLTVRSPESHAANAVAAAPAKQPLFNTPVNLRSRRGLGEHVSIPWSSRFGPGRCLAVAPGAPEAGGGKLPGSGLWLYRRRGVCRGVGPRAWHS